MGIVPRTVRGNWKDGDYMYSIYHDGVQYAIDDMGDYEIDADVSYILECLESRRLIIERNHTLVRDIYDHIKTKLSTDIWVRVEGGRQLNCTFGDSRGAICSLIMDFIDPEQFTEAIEKIRNLLGVEWGDVPPDFDAMMKFALVVEECEMDVFKDFSNPLVEVLNVNDML
jgi:hypothetical protein